MSLNYEQLSEKQIRIAIHVLGLEDQIAEAVNTEITKALGDTLLPFDLTVEELFNTHAAAGNTRSKPGAGGVTAAPRKSTGSSRLKVTAGVGRKKKSPAISAEQLASRQLQGRYLGAIRRVPKGRRKQYQAIAKQDRAKAIDAINRDYPPK